MARAWILAVGAMVAVADGGSIAQAALEPHRAAYRLKLAEKHRASPLTYVRGGLVIEYRLGCDGWLSRQRLRFGAATEGGEGITHDVRFSSWESLDGLRLRYTVRSFEGDVLQEEYRGEAWLDSKDGGGVASFGLPHEEKVILPSGTVFPTDHIRRVLEEAGAGKRFVSHEVFDGWGFDALTQITSVIGSPRTVEPALAEVGKSRAWPVSMAYYNIERKADTPDFEAAFLLTEEGVLRELLLDYGEFQLDATLESLELLERPAC
jgi:hypothetical protein